MVELTNEQINDILNQYQRKKEKEKERYNKIKDTEDFKLKNRERAKNHYQNNKEVKKNKYQDNKDYLNARSSYYYYKKMNKLEDFKNKYPEKIKLLSDNNLII